MYFQSKNRNKYKNIKQEYGGYIYASKKESNRAFELDMLLKAKEIKAWKKQVTLPLYFGEYHICSYRMDFVVFNHDGSVVLEEIKGFETYGYKLKRNLLEAILDQKNRDERKKVLEVLGIKKDTEVEYHIIK